MYVKCPIEVCEEGEIKGMYAKARTGEIKQFTNNNSPFEESDKADIIVGTNKQSVEESKEIIRKALSRKGYLPN